MDDIKRQVQKEILGDIIKYCKEKMVAGEGDEQMEEGESVAPAAVEIEVESHDAENKEDPMAEVKSEMPEEEKEDAKAGLESFLKGKAPSAPKSSDEVTVSMLGVGAKKPDFKKGKKPKF